MFRLLNAGAVIVALVFCVWASLAMIWTVPTILATIGFVIYDVLGAKKRKQAEADRILGLVPAQMTPTEYELLCCELLRAAGWSVRHVGRQGDQGVDAIAELRGIRVAIQAKNYRQLVGNAAIQQVAAGRHHWGCHSAVVVSPLGAFSIPAQQLAHSNSVILMAHSELGQLEKLIGVPV